VDPLGTTGKRGLRSSRDARFPQAMQEADPARSSLLELVPRASRFALARDDRTRGRAGE